MRYSPPLREAAGLIKNGCALKEFDEEGPPQGEFLSMFSSLKTF